MSKELNCMNCSIGDFKHELCDCDNGFCKEFKGIGSQEDFFNAVIQRRRPQGEWIPVSERLPEDGIAVLITTENEEVHIDQVITDPYKERYFQSNTGYDNFQVVAWMPLPKPYKESDME